MVRPKVRVVLLSGVAIGLAFVLWQEVADPRTIEVSPEAIDFGLLQPGPNQKQSIVFRNPGPGMALVRIVSDCDCVQLSEGGLRVPAGEEASVEVGLNRRTGERRDQLYSAMESRLLVTCSSQNEQRSFSIPVTAKFYEPYVVDRDACRVNVMAGELPEVKIPFSAANSEVGKPTIPKMPSFVQSVRVNWNEAFSSGELALGLTPGILPGRYAGIIELAPGLQPERAKGYYSLPFEVLVRPPCRFDPITVVLGGQGGDGSQMVTLRSSSSLPCRIKSATNHSKHVTVEQRSPTSLVVRKKASDQVGSDPSKVNHVKAVIECELERKNLEFSQSFAVYLMD